MNRTSFLFRRSVVVSSVIVSGALCAVPAGAQQQASEPAVSFGLGLGAAAAPGRSIGSVGLATLEVATPWRNFDVRVDGAYTSWQGPFSSNGMVSLTGNLMYSRPVGIFSPYLIGGLGGYAQQGTGALFGLNGGLGVKASVGRLHPFLELREHVWSADRTRRASGLTVGLMF